MISVDLLTMINHPHAGEIISSINVEIVTKRNQQAGFVKLIIQPNALQEAVGFLGPREDRSASMHGSATDLQCIIWI